MNLNESSRLNCIDDWIKNNKNIKENISIMILLYLIGSILGTIINLVGVSI